MYKKNRTNITELPNSFTSSRGHLVSSFLLSDSSSPLEDEVGKVVSPDAKFAGFNLLLLAPAPPSVSTIPKETLEAHERELELTAEETTVHSRDQKLSYDAMLVTNHGGGGPLQARRLIPTERACGCISNGIDGKGGNEWPKVRRAVSSFDDVLKNYSPNSDLVSENLLVEKLFGILVYVWVSLSDFQISESPSPSSAFVWHSWQPSEPIKERAQLRDTIQVTPISLATQSSDAKQIRTPRDTPIPAVTTISVSTPKTSDALPPAQIVTHVSARSQDLYGTRLSTVLLIRSDGSVLFIERDIWRLGQDGNPERVEHNTKQRVFEFELDLAWLQPWGGKGCTQAFLRLPYLAKNMQSYDGFRILNVG